MVLVVRCDDVERTLSAPAAEKGPSATPHGGTNGDRSAVLRDSDGNLVQLAAKAR